MTALAGARAGIVGAMDEESRRRVLDVVAAIQPGEVLSYGEVARLAGIASARLVGRILADSDDELPWHRVIHADGTFAPHLADRQAALLRRDGVSVIAGRVARRD